MSVHVSAPTSGGSGMGVKAWLEERRYGIHSVDEGGDGLVDIAADRYDLTTFSGRLAHFYSVTSPLTLFYSNASLKEAQALVDGIEAQFPSDRRKGYMVSKEEAERYWKARQLVDSSVHPDTGDVVPLPFRLSAFVPTNLVIVAGMLLPNPSLASTIGWQWANQTLNVAVNYSNANKSVPMNMTEVGIAYAAATTSAVSIAVGLNRLVPRLKLPPSTKATLARLVPFASVATAGCVNISCMRWKEIKDGVTVFKRNEDGSREKVGESAVAGRKAVGMTAASRVLTNIPTLILPPLLMTYLQRRRIVPQGGAVSRAAELSLIGISLWAFLPPAVATFPQTATVQPRSLEKRFHELEGPLEYNKGL